MKKVLLFVGLLSVGVIVWRLMPLRISVPPASSPPSALVLKDLTSTIQVPVTVGLNQLENFLEDEIPKSKEEFMVNLLSGYKLKRGPMKVKSGKQGVTVSSHVRGKGTALLLAKVEVDGDFAVSVRPTIDANWEPNLHVKVDADVDTAKINIKFAPDIHFRGRAENEIEDFGERHATQLNRTFGKQLALKDRVSDYWKRAHTNVQLNTNPQFWLSLAPVSASILPLDYGAKDAVQSIVELSLNVGLHLSSNPPPSQPRPLPPLKQAKALTNGFNILLPTILELSELATALETGLATTTVRLPGKETVRFGHVTLGHDGEQLKIGVEIKTPATWWHRPTQVTIELDGTPFLDQRRQELRLENVDFSARSREALISGAGWLLEPVISKEIERLAVLSLPAHLRDLKKAAQKELNTAKIPEWLSASITLDSVSVYRLAVTEGHLIVVLQAAGKAEVSGINFVNKPTRSTQR